jgi:predicted esterase
VFPSGSLKPVAALGQAGGKKYNAWFDFASFADRTLDEVQQIPGMCESVTYLSKLISDEVELLNQGFIREGMEGGGMGRVVIAGFSQGAAIGLMTLLSGELERLGVGIGERGGFAGFVALSGYLPFRAQICAEILGGGKEKSHDVDNAMKRGKAVLYVRELLGLDAGGVGDRDVGLGSTVIKRGYLDVPIFVAHGEEDVKMKFRWGEEMQDVLIEMGMHVTFESYAGLEHWYCADEMLDFVEFLRGCWHGTEA